MTTPLWKAGGKIKIGKVISYHKCLKLNIYRLMLNALCAFSLFSQIVRFTGLVRKIGTQ